MPAGPPSVDARTPGRAQPPVPTEALLARLDTPGPRYTTYPTDDRFVEAFGATAYAQALRQRAEGAAVGGPGPLSLYVHVPFCESSCWHCACNKVITKHHGRAAPYLDALEQELALHTAAMGTAQPVSQLHLGGGTPTFLSDAELARLVRSVGRSFRMTPNAEVSIEVDPRTATPERLASLRDLGFNRVSLGLQDTDPDVQAAVHRVQPFEQVCALMQAARRLGFVSTNADLMYGLPRQTPESFARTIEAVRQLRPDRIALYGYTHLPQRFEPQRRIHASDLPIASQRVAMLGAALSGFAAAGYVYIGMDHFALPDDALALAKRQGRLHRNVQGYSTQPDGDLIGLGVSSIGRVGATYGQNARTLDAYHDALRQRQFAITRGLALTRDDIVRRGVIMALVCQGHVAFESIELAHLIDFAAYFRAELAALEPLANLGLVEVRREGIDVTPLGWYFVRAVAMVFDRCLRADQARARFSRVI